MRKWAWGVAMWAAAGAVLAQAPAWPDKPVRVIVPFPASGATDLVARVVTQRVAADLGQQMVVDNKPGAGGTIGSAEAAKAPPDGYTLLLTTSSTHAISPHLMPRLAYDARKDFTPVAHLADAPSVLLVTNSLPVKTVGELIAYGKAHPGKLTLGNTGTYTSPHVTSAIIAQQLGLDVVHVPYKGSAELMRATMAGEVMVAADTSAVIPYVDQGRMVALNVWTEKRLPTLPHTPTLIELGLPTTQYSPFGLVGPKGMPADVQAILHKAFKEAMEMESYQAMLQRFEMLPIYMNSADYKKFAAESTVKEKAVLAKLGPQA